MRPMRLNMDFKRWMNPIALNDDQGPPGVDEAMQQALTAR